METIKNFISADVLIYIEPSKETIENLKKEHISYLKNKGLLGYQKLTSAEKKIVENNFVSWWINKDPIGYSIYQQDCPISLKKWYYAEVLLDLCEFDFISWSKKRGFIVKVQNIFECCAVLAE